MKNQSLRGKLEESVICVGAIERAGKCQGLRSVGGKQVQMQGFLPEPHVIDSLYGMVGQG